MPYVVYEPDAAIFLRDADESLYLEHFDFNQCKNPWAHGVDPHGVVHLMYVVEWAREVSSQFARYVRWTTRSVLRCSEVPGTYVSWPLVPGFLTCLSCIVRPP